MDLSDLTTQINDLIALLSEPTPDVASALTKLATLKSTVAPTSLGGNNTYGPLTIISAA